MNFIDNFKIRTIIEESISSFKFLDSVKVQDDISSELAGFQISKLLKNQEENQRRFAELVKKRATLTKITQKEELQQIEAEIANLSIILKESTKKLCKLFKQNPDLEADSIKVTRQRRMLIIKLEELMEFIKASSTSKFTTFITHELESQDQMRRLLEKQKNLNIQIKKLQQEKMSESKEYQKEISENQSRIQEYKEELMKKMQENKMDLEYQRKEASADIENKKRILDQSQKVFQKELQTLRVTVSTQKLVHSELQEYLKHKNEDIKKKSEELSNKSDTAKQNFENQIAKLNELVEQTTQELDLFKQKYQEEEERKIQREKAERDKLMQKKRKEEQLVRLNNAIKYIQNQYLAWKESGGGKKKKKK